MAVTPGRRPADRPSWHVHSLLALATAVLLAAAGCAREAPATVGPTAVYRVVHDGREVPREAVEALVAELTARAAADEVQGLRLSVLEAGGLAVFARDEAARDAFLRLTRAVHVRMQAEVEGDPPGLHVLWTNGDVQPDSVRLGRDEMGESLEFSLEAEAAERVRRWTNDNVGDHGVITVDAPEGRWGFVIEVLEPIAEGRFQVQFMDSERVRKLAAALTFGAEGYQLLPEPEAP
jgi:hypothetical protein